MDNKNLDSFQKKIAQAVVELPFQYGLCFAASCCERLAPVYTAFSLVEKWRNPKTIKHGNDLIWRYLEGEDIDSNSIGEMIVKCEKSVPDPNEVDFFLDIPAMSACGAIFETLRACQNQDTKMLVVAGGCALDAVSDYARVLNSPASSHSQDYRIFMKEMEHSPLVLEEMEHQEETLALLSTQPTINQDFLMKLRSSATKSGIRPFERGLVPAYLWKPIYEPGLVSTFLATAYGV